MLSHQDLNHQRQSQQTKKLASEISELKEMFQGGGLVPIIEKMVGEILNKDREKEPEARMAKYNVIFHSILIFIETQPNGSPQRVCRALRRNQDLPNPAKGTPP